MQSAKAPPFKSELLPRIKPQLTNQYRRAHKKGLLLKTCKCHFAKSLEFVASRKGIEAHSAKIEAVSKYSRRMSLKSCRPFLGLCSYCRRLINDFSEFRSQFNWLTKTDTPFNWTEIEEESFAKLRRALKTARVLVRFNANLHTEIPPDSNAYAIGMVILQRNEEDRERMVVCGSRKLLHA